ncbi:DUF461 domain-containing protein [Streptomyces sp. NPDC018031]|uniref:DUF461 domain-containing protein n=1 Tax=Streptomyces sp. NPDC018031 TaxID=3365033 RepID=UPI003788966B
MSSDLRRGALAATALVLSIAPLSACAAGNDPQTLEIKPDNAATSVGTVKIQNVNVVTQPELNAKGPAVVTGRIFNTGRSAQTLESITVGDTTAKLRPAKGSSGKLVIPAGGALTLGGEGNPAAVVENGREAARDGDAQKVTFDLSSTGEVTLQAFVVPATGYFDQWGPETPPAPAEPAKPTGSAKPTGEEGEEGEHGAPAGTTKPGGHAGDDQGAEHGTTEPGGATNSQGIASGEPDPNGQAGH